MTARIIPTRPQELRPGDYFQWNDRTYQTASEPALVRVRGVVAAVGVDAATPDGHPVGVFIIPDDTLVSRVIYPSGDEPAQALAAEWKWPDFGLRATIAVTVACLAVVVVIGLARPPVAMSLVALTAVSGLLTLVLVGRAEAALLYLARAVRGRR